MFNIKEITARYPVATIGITCFIALLITTYVMKTLELTTIVNNIELKTLDWRFQRAAKKQILDDRIVLVVLDDISLQQAQSEPYLHLPERLKPDGIAAKLIEYISLGKPAIIAFNSKFEGNQFDTKESKPFMDAVKKADNVIFPVVFQQEYLNLVEATKKSYETSNFNTNIPLEAIIKHHMNTLLNKNNLDLREKLKKFSLYIPNEDLFTTFNYNALLEYLNFSPIYIELLNNCRSIGAINISSDEDGIIRTTMPLISYNKNIYPSLAMAITINFLQNNNNLKFLSNGNLRLGNKVIPISNEGNVLINWKAKAGSYKHYRISDIITSYNSFQSMEEPNISPEVFRNKIVLIGDTTAGPNKLTTPVSHAISGTEVQANIVDCFINNDQFITRCTPLINFILALIFSFGMGVIVLKLRSGFTVATVYSAIVIIYILLALFLFNNYLLWIDIIFPLGFMTIVFIVTFLVKYTIMAKAYEDTYQLAIKDGLTGLFNHKYFQETLSRDMKRALRHNETFSLLILDIDNFKKFNDKYGHRAGDAILKQVSSTLKMCVRTSDLVARYGGEELAVILYNSNYKNAQIVAHKILNDIQKNIYVFKNHTYKDITVSIGVSNYPLQALSPSALIDVADKAMYKAKNNGRNQVGTVDTRAIQE